MPRPPIGKKPSKAALRAPVEEERQGGEDEAGPSQPQPKSQGKRGSGVGIKRKQPDAEGDDGGEEVEDAEPLPVLVPRTRRIKDSVMTSKFALMSENSQAETMKFLRSLKGPVMTSAKSDKERQVYQQAIEGVLSKIERKLANDLVVPPGHKDKYFNYETLNADNTRLQAQLQYEQREIADLEREIKREKKRLDTETKQRDHLEKAGLDERATFRKKNNMFHPVLKKFVVTVEVEAEIAAMNMMEKDDLRVGVEYDPREDTELGVVTRRMENHLVSLQGNREALGNLPSHLRRTRAVVDEMLYLTGRDVEGRRVAEEHRARNT